MRLSTYPASLLGSLGFRPLDSDIGVNLYDVPRTFPQLAMAYTSRGLALPHRTLPFMCLPNLLNLGGATAGREHGFFRLQRDDSHCRHRPS